MRVTGGKRGGLWVGKGGRVMGRTRGRVMVGKARGLWVGIGGGLRLGKGESYGGEMGRVIIKVEGFRWE